MLCLNIKYIYILSLQLTINMFLTMKIRIWRYGHISFHIDHFIENE